jgi:hypothetical protein
MILAMLHIILKVLSFNFEIGLNIVNQPIVSCLNGSRVDNGVGLVKMSAC